MLASANQRLLAWLPSYWFLGLFQQLSGAHAPEFEWLARRAWIVLAFVLVGVLITVLLSYLHAMRKAVEEPDILPGSRHSAWRMPSFVGSVESAVLLFSLRTILRSRQHRILLSFYLGAGFGVVLILLRPSMAHGGNPAVPLLVASAC